VAIVDDEMPARQILREFLDGDAGVEIVAECANGFDAVKAVAEQRPLELVGRDTAVIFTTAYDEYALRAFDVHAIDYLLKPFSRERLHEALGRARTRLAKGSPPATPADLAGAARPPGAWLTRVVIRDGAEVHVVPIDKIDYVEAQDDYIGVRVGERMLLKEQPLGELEKQLDPRRFVRIHRSFLLNLDRLARLEPAGKDSKIAVLRDGRRLPVSRSGYTRLQELL
jgi:two-component system LytT family response regulator